MNIALWVVQGLLAAMFGMAGVMKTFDYAGTKKKLPWVKDVPKGLVLFIGASELLGAIGLILPRLTGVVPILTPLAAAGIGLIMVLAAVFHSGRKEMSGVAVNLVFLAMAAFVAWGRFTGTMP